MKRAFLFTLALLLIISLAACAKAPEQSESNPSTQQLDPTVSPTAPSADSTRPTVPSTPDASMPPATTPSGDTVPDVPMDFDQAADELGTDVKIYYHPDSPDCIENLAISGEDVLYQSISTYNETEDGITHHFVVTTNHVGQLTASSGKNHTIKFSGAYLLVTFPGDTAEQTREFMLEMLEDAPLSESGQEAFRQLIGGAKIYAAADSELWETLVNTSSESKVILSGDTFRFNNGEPGQLYHDRVKDDLDRELKDTAYYFDEDGTKWIESIDEYEYYDDGRRHTHTFYHPYSNQIQTYYISVSSFDGTTTQFTIVEEYEYYADGTPKTKTYQDENGNPAHFEYAEDGTKLYEEYTNGDGTQISASYLEGGILHSYTSLSTDGTYVEQWYYDNGNLSQSITSRNDLLVEEKEGYESGDLRYLKQYYESGNLHFQYDYHEGGYLNSITEFYDTDQWDYMRIEYYQGNIIHQINIYYPNGEEQSMTMYFFTESEDDLRVRKYHEGYENGETAKYYEYDAEGNVIDGREYYENGNWKYSYSLLDDGTIDETDYHENGQMKKSHTIHPDGSEYICEWNEDGSCKYDFRDFGNGETLEWVYDENGLLLRTRSEYADGSWGVTEYNGYYDNGQVKQAKGWGSNGAESIIDYYENGQCSRWYVKSEDGLVEIIYYDEDGNFLWMETM